MESASILQSHILDIVFENRNKSYGAYLLRKYYSRRMVTALSLVGALSLVFLLVCQVTSEKIVAKVYFFDPPEKAPPPLYKQAPTPPPQEHKTFTPDKSLVPVINTAGNAPVIVADDFKTPIIKGIPDFVPAPNAGDGSSSIMSSPGTNTAVLLPPPLPQIPIIKAPLFTAAVMPSFPGGVEALRKYLSKNLQSPGELQAGEIITVLVRFVVAFDGSLKSFHILKDGGKAFNEEVIRVIKKMPAWVPGESAGEKVDVYYSIPIVFQGYD
ncbi:MAG: energy transducer TonB [Ferruginibacter sp.]